MCVSLDQVPYPVFMEMYKYGKSFSGKLKVGGLHLLRLFCLFSLFFQGRGRRERKRRKEEEAVRTQSFS